jgi:hypothetical protein
MYGFNAESVAASSTRSIAVVAASTRARVSASSRITGSRRRSKPEQFSQPVGDLAGARREVYGRLRAVPELKRVPLLERRPLPRELGCPLPVSVEARSVLSHANPSTARRAALQ